MPKRKKIKIVTDGQVKEKLGTLGDLLGQLPIDSSTKSDTSLASPDKSEPESSSRGVELVIPQKTHIRKERKGRAGKTVTIIGNLNMSPDALQALSKKLRKQLGCGSGIENDEIVLQGDLEARVRDWLNAHRT